MGMGHAVELASEINPDIFRIYKKNFNPRILIEGDILEYFDGEVSDSQLTENEGRLVDDYPGLVSPDLLVGGPPCQGHSEINK